MKDLEQFKLEEGALKEYTYSILSFGVTETLVKYRKENGISQKELAKLLGVSQARISKIEAGNNLSLKMLCDINEKLETKEYSFILTALDNMKKRAEALYNKSYYIEIPNLKLDIKWENKNIEYNTIINKELPDISNNDCTIYYGTQFVA